MENVSVVMPIMAVLSIMLIIVVLIIVGGIVKQARIKSINSEKFDNFAEEILKENSEMKKDIQVIKEKVEAIDKMIRDI